MISTGLILVFMCKLRKKTTTTDSAKLTNQFKKSLYFHWQWKQSISTWNLWLVWRATQSTVASNWTPAKNHWSVKQKHLSQAEKPPVRCCSADADLCSRSLKVQTHALFIFLHVVFFGGFKRRSTALPSHVWLSKSQSTLLSKSPHVFPTSTPTPWKF